ncbi:MAG: DUF3310 domain-containing protein [Bacilli bacterium]|nr:DUF3310 domain-containing protein [Bacilli bacterium]
MNDYKNFSKEVKTIMGESYISAEKPDMVNHPNHYTKGGIECIDIIRVIVSSYKNPFCAALVGNIIKYIYRAPNKNGLEDLKKAQWYLNRLIVEWEK